MKCSCCNTIEHEPTAKFCHVCGHRLDEVFWTTHPTNAIPEFVAPVKLKGQWLLIDSKSRTVKELPHLDTGWYSVHPFHEGFSLVSHNSKKGYIDKTGHEVIPTVYHGGSNFSEQRAAVSNGSLWGYLDTSGNVVIPFEYNCVRDFSDGLAAVEKNDKWGFIDRMGRTVIPFIFEYALSFSQGLASVRFKDRYGYIDKNGRVAIPSRNDSVGIGNFLQKQIRSIFGSPILLNTVGNLITRLPFYDALSFSEGIAAVVIKEENKHTWHETYRYRFIDKLGNFIRFSHCGNSFGMSGGFSEGIVAVSPGNYVHRCEILKRSEDFGYIDASGKNIHGFHLSTAYPFKEGLARVGFTEGGVKHSGFIDKSGALVLDYKDGEYDVFHNFSCGLTPIGKREGNGWRYGYIDKKGNVVIPFKYDEAYEFGK